MADRIIEISQLLKVRQEEGFLVDRDSEKYSVNAKRFNMFLCYDIDNIQLYNKNFYIPNDIKYNFRCIGMNYIGYREYLKIAFSAYGIQKSDEIQSKIIYILELLMGKSKILMKKNLKKIVFQNFIEYILNKFIARRNEIDSNKMYDILKECFKEIFFPFIQTEQETQKNIECLLNIILFDYKEKERINELKKLKINDILNNNVTEQKNIKSVEKENKNDIQFDNICNEMLTNFSFGNDDYKKKIKNFYNSLNCYQWFVLIGPALTGKSNLLVTMRDISLKLNEINSGYFPVFNYIRFFPNNKDYSDLFVKNDIKYSYQINNVYFKGIVDILRRSGVTLENLNQRYKKMQFELYYNIIEKKEKTETTNNNDGKHINENANKVDNHLKKEIEEKVMSNITPINENDEYENKKDKNSNDYDYNDDNDELNKEDEKTN